MVNQQHIPYTVIGHTKRDFQNSPGTIFSVVRNKEELTNLCVNRSLSAEKIASEIDFSKHNLIGLSRFTNHRSNFLGIKTVGKIQGVVNIEFGEVDMDNGARRIAMPRPGYSSVFFKVDKGITSSRVNPIDLGKMKIEQLDSQAASISEKKSKAYKEMNKHLAELLDILEFEEFNKLEKTGDPSSLNLNNPQHQAHVAELYSKCKKAELEHSEAKKQFEQRRLQVVSRVSGPLI